jgi:hypothetical protein
MVGMVILDRADVLQRHRMLSVEASPAPKFDPAGLPLRPQAARRNIGPCTHPQTTDEHVSAGKSIARQHRNVRK